MSPFLRPILCCLAAALLTTLAAAQQNAGGSDNSAERRFDPALFEPVVDRSRGLSERERTLLLRLLAQSDSPSYSEQRQAARELVGGRRAKMPEFDDRSDSEFLVEDLLRATRLYRGRPIELKGYARNVEKRQAEANEFGISRYYRLRLYVAEGDNSPVDVYFLSLPGNWPAGGEFVDDVSVVGRFFKLIEYDDRQRGGVAYAPVVVAERVEHRPRIEPGAVRLDAALWEGTVRHKQRGWTNDERDLYYRVLHHARDADYDEQKQQARKNLQARIERYRDEAKDEFEQIKQRAERYLQEHPGEEAEQRRLLNDAERRYRRKLNMYRRYRDNPRLFPTFADLIINDSTSWRGRLITLEGRVRHLTKSPVDANVRYKLGTLYEVWFYTEDSQAHPAVAIATSVPDGLLEKAREEGDRLDEPVTVTGYFFRMHVYQAQDTDRFAPMLLARRIEWGARAEEKTYASDVYVLPVIGLLVGGMAVGMAWFFWKAKREDRKFRQHLAAARDETAVPEFDQLGADLRPPEPSFENVEASPEPDFRDHEPGVGSS